MQKVTVDKRVLMNIIININNRALLLSPGKLRRALTGKDVYDDYEDFLSSIISMLADVVEVDVPPQLRKLPRRVTPVRLRLEDFEAE